MDNTKINILVGCPTARTIGVKTVSCIQNLMLPTIYVADSLVYDARNELVNNAIKLKANYLLFIDSDMEFEPEAVQSLITRDVDICTGLYVERNGEHRPTIYSDLDIRTKDHDAYKVNCTKEEIKPFFKVKGCGMGFCLIKTEVFKKIIAKYGDCFQPVCGLGEDLSFCWKCEQLDIDIWCDSTFTLGHIGEYVYTIKDWEKENKNEDLL